MKHLLPLLLCIIFLGCSKENANKKFLKEYHDFCYSLRPELEKMDYKELTNPTTKLPKELEKKILTFLKKNKSRIKRSREIFLQDIAGTIPETPNASFEELADISLAIVMLQETYSDSIDAALQSPLIRLKMLSPMTFTALASTMILARKVTPEQMGRQSLIGQFSGVQSRSKKIKGNKWQLFYNSGFIQIYSTYDLNSGKTTIEKVYMRKREES